MAIIRRHSARVPSFPGHFVRVRSFPRHFVPNVYFYCRGGRVLHHKHVCFMPENRPLMAVVCLQAVFGGDEDGYRISLWPQIWRCFISLGLCTSIL